MTIVKIKCLTNAVVVTADFKELGMTVEEQMNRMHKLKICDVCSREADPLGGVKVRTKWHCARCWVKLMQRGLK